MHRERPPTTWECPLRIGVPRESRARESRVAATPATVASSSPSATRWPSRPMPARAAASPTGLHDGRPRTSPAEDAWDPGRRPEGERTVDRAELGRSAANDADQPAGPRVAPGAGGGAGRSRPITALALDAAPRISRPSRWTCSPRWRTSPGYRAVIEAAHTFGRFFTGQVTAAGKVPPAKVLVVGAGVPVRRRGLRAREERQSVGHRHRAAQQSRDARGRAQVARAHRAARARVRREKLLARAVGGRAVLLSSHDARVAQEGDRQHHARALRRDARPRRRVRARARMAATSRSAWRD